MSLLEMKEAVRRQAGDMKVAVAFDYMKFRIGDIAVLEKFNPALSRLFESSAKEDEEKKKKPRRNN
ncbi:hypothetical protein AOQ84DRAFT_49951 [Glonium stellatum]|uniref:Uncharacterized protein n=1 Tax=Glonium stellatum TaxID=574774 RepID=A0A8E2JSH0_9PEZI|nr:hypothetical protein AOQ84DRAFT_49951 [Glonium stellatum]